VKDRPLRNLDGSGNAEERQGHYKRAARRYQQALVIARKMEDRYIECSALINLGTVRLRQGRTQEARDRLQEALALYQEISDRAGEADALNSLGFATTLPIREAITRVPEGGTTVRLAEWFLRS
jgi:tetratricopeptide (TPR) repeat protein